MIKMLMLLYGDCTILNLGPSVQLDHKLYYHLTALSSTTDAFDVKFWSFQRRHFSASSYQRDDVFYEKIKLPNNKMIVSHFQCRGLSIKTLSS